MSSRGVAPAAACVLFALVALAAFAAGDKDDDAEKAQPAQTEQASGPPAGDAECRWAHGPVEIDGKADEQDWNAAQVVENFNLPWLGDEARPARTATRARLIWDREYLYFFADMDDSDLYADVTEHDGQVWTNDAFEIFLKPSADHAGYYEFNFNPANVSLDMFLPRRNAGGYERFKSDGEFDTKTAVQLRGTLNKWSDGDQGWSVEGRIAWESLARTGGRPNPGERWNFALCRVDYSVDFEGPELSTTAPRSSTPHPDFHRHEDYGTLTFVGPEKSTHGPPYGIDQFVPLTTSRVLGSPDPPLPYRLVKAFPKLDIRHPIYVTSQPGSDRLVAINQVYSSNTCTVLRFPDDPDADPSQVETLLDLDATAYEIEFHLDFANNGYVYVGLNGPQSSTPRKCQVVRYRMDPKPPHVLDPASATVIIEWESDGHNGCGLAFGADGMLYITSGDGTTDSDRWVSGQDLTRLLAKVLRIDVDRPDEGKHYSVPADNPFVGQEDVRPETWAYGFRNPWRMTADPKTGHLWVGNNGQDTAEQVYLVERGANYGWSVMEGSLPFYLDRQRGPHPITKPTLDHPHSEARSLTGGEVYYGAQFPELHGAYVYGDYSTGKLWAAKHDGRAVVWHKPVADSALSITAISLDTKGELLVADHGKGGFYKFEAVSQEQAAGGPSFPRKLSESGLFASVKDHAMAPGVIPYSVNSELWSDGAFKQRYLAIPRADDPQRKIEYVGARGWNFPNETVLVKSFALETQAGNPASRKWVETRFLTRQDGEWAGYSYVWNDEQTDATLVDAAGMDRAFEIADPAAPGGVRTQVWHYPGRAECMVCHTSMSNFVLGLQTAQMNKDHDYGAAVPGGRVDNQLRTLEHLGLFRVNWLSELNGARARKLMAETDTGYWESLSAAGQMVQTRDQREPVVGPLLPLNPPSHDRLADPRDPSAGLTARAKSYIHANCANCHIESGGGNALMELEYSVVPADMRVLDVPPLHASFDLPDPKIIAPGDAHRSVLLHRVATRGPGQMPPLATSVVDEQGVELLREWIASLNPASEATGAAEAPKE